ncbi:MAG: (d)CMP kinase [Alphaproteobacteria bacterium]|jgi:cytidylate kinase|nr:(d)CMP kinase [Alphaproteobacteria bacterium]MBP7729682.1 (d)CMP kinase [Alphaproteobacteria bacterium]
MSFVMIAIDGPAGAGKGTLAHHLARLYNLSHLDTGLLYRGVALKMIEKEQFLVNEEAAIRAALSLKTEDLKNSSLRDEVVGNLASEIAALPQVREILLKFQRDFAKNVTPGKQGVVLDGRDIGLVVLPESLCKIYVTASPEVRAQRRLKELQQKGISSIYEDVFKDIQTRDVRDEKRKISPLRPAKDAYILDTSELGIDDVIKKACLFVDLKYPEIDKIA